MKPESTWQFSAAIENVDVVRVLREAGPAARCVRLTIDGKVYTAVNIYKTVFLPAGSPVSSSAAAVSKSKTDGWQLCEDTTVFRGSDGNPLIVTSLKSNGTRWFLYQGDRVGEVMDRVVVVAEIF